MVSFAMSLGYVYINRMEIPIAKSFEDNLDAQLEVVRHKKEDLKKIILQLEAERRLEVEFREKAQSDSYSDPYRILKILWFNLQIYALSSLQFLFTYRVILYFIVFAFIFIFLSKIFGRLYL